MPGLTHQIIEAEWCIYASLNKAIIGSDNSLLSDQRQVIIWTSADISNVFSWIKISEFLLEFHWSLFPVVQLAVNQHCRVQATIRLQWVNPLDVCLWLGNPSSCLADHGEPHACACCRTMHIAIQVPYYAVCQFIAPLSPQIKNGQKYLLHTVETLYNTINFCWRTHKRHSIARPKGRGMGCLLWVQRATYCVDLPIWSSIKYLL